MEGIHLLASGLDIDYTLAKITGDVFNHAIMVNEEASTIDVFYTPCIPVKAVKVNFKLALRDKV